MHSSVRTYYTAQSRFSEPGGHAPLLAALPGEIAELQAALHGLLVHLWIVRRDEPARVEHGDHDVATRHIARLLDHLLALDASPLDVARPVDRRAVVDCRHFALLMTAILRQRGVAARARCGFATFLEETHAEDHWVCEYWDDQRGRWVMADPDQQRHDVPTGEFISGSRAWQLCRSGHGLCDRFGFGPEARGQWVARVNLVRDFAALNGFECVTGDAWGLALAEEATLREADVIVLDQAAILAANDDALAERQALYAATEGLRAPALIHHLDYLATFEWQAVNWNEEA